MDEELARRAIAGDQQAIAELFEQEEAVLYRTAYAYLKNEHGVSEFLSKIQTDSIKFGCIQSLDEFDGLNAKKVKDAMISKFDDFLPDSVKAKPREGINES